MVLFSGCLSVATNRNRSASRGCGSSEEIVVAEKAAKPAEPPARVIVNVPAPLGAQLDLAPKTVQKSVQDIMLKPRQHWVGDGFHVFPVFDRKAFKREMTPFLMFDYAAPKHFEPTRSKKGVGKHPHRGFETVTVAWQGEVEHGDHMGNSDVIFPGDVQWMTAGRGIVHEEYHSRDFAKRGGLFEMCQLWVNLPSQHKMTAPVYQPISSHTIPSIPLPLGAGCVRVIAGDFLGVKGPSRTFTPIDMWEVLLDKSGGKTDLVFPEGHNTIIFIKSGAAAVGAKRSKLSQQDVALMGTHGRQVPVEAMEDGTALLILSGEPINEPIANRGPMVMNTQDELNQAFDDYQGGRNGFGRR